MTSPSYVRAVTSSVQQAVVTGLWIAAGELVPARRRLARFGTVAVVSGVVLLLDRRSDEPSIRFRFDPGDGRDRTADGEATPPVGSEATPTAGGPASPAAADGTSPAAGARYALSDRRPHAGGADRAGSVDRAGDRAAVIAEANRALAAKLADPEFKRKRTIGLVSIAGGVLIMLTRREAEKRWMARLARQGHPHPHRALAVRMGVLTLTTMLPSRLFEAYEARRRPPADPSE